MIKNYIWTFNDVALASGLNGAFSLEYHVPCSKMKVPIETLVGSRVWLIVKSGDESFLYALLSPLSIELYKEGRYKDDFLLKCEPFSSMRFLPRQESCVPWQLSFKTDEEICECTDVEQAALIEIVNKNQRVGFAPPSRSILDTVPRTSFNNLENAVPDQLMSTLRTVSFGDASRSRSLPDTISALGGITLTILALTHPHLDESDVISLIAALDPLSKIDSGVLIKSQKEILHVLSSLPPIVDTFFEEIDPEKLSPRTFVAKSTDSSFEWLDKTNAAEETHERILKDVVLHLKDKDFKVYKTRSFDLFAEKGDVKLLWEIKSANGLNSVSQGEKGIIQLLRYSTALSSEKYADIRFLVLLQDSGLVAIHEYLSKMAKCAGSELWLYNEKKDWPGRIFNMTSNLMKDLV